MSKAVLRLKTWLCNAHRDELIITLAGLAAATVIIAFFMGKLQALCGGCVNNVIIPGNFGYRP